MLIKTLACVFLLFFGFSFTAFASEPSVSARAAVLMIAETREVVYSKNMNERLPMASTTKIMSSLVALECSEPNRIISATADALKVEGTSMGLLPGDSVSIHALICGMLLSSGNDAANVVAREVGGSVERFVGLMNKRAKQLGMKNTSFVTPSGLDSAEHYSTAYDMALLGSYAIGVPEFRAICSQRSMKVSFGNPPFDRWLSNHNRLLREYDGAIGIKTGFTKKSGRCLVSAAERDGITLVCVTLKAPSDWSDHRNLLDYGFSVTEKVTPECDLSNVKVKVFGGNAGVCAVRLFEAPQIPLASNGKELSYELSLPPYLYAPVKNGEIIGEARFYLDGRQVFATSLCADNRIDFVGKIKTEPEKEGFFKRFKQMFIDWIKR